MMGKKLPEGWEWKKLNDLAQFIYGYPFDSSKFNNRGRGTPLIRIRNLIKDKTDTFFDGEFEESYLVQNGDLLIGMDGEFNIIRWGGEGALLNQRICKLESTSATLIPSYAFRVLKKILKRIEDKTPHVTVKHLSAKQLNSIQIPIPPLETQRKIVTILEKAEETKKLRMQADELADQLLQSVFLEMFGDPVKNPKGWEVKTLGDVCTLIKDGPHVSPNYVEEGVPFITVHNIIKGFFDLCNVKYISKEDHTEFCKRCKPERGDVLYSKGGTTGFAKRVDVEFEFSIWVHLALLKFPKDRINPIFLETCLNSNYCKVQAKRYTRGIANRDLVLGQMAKIKIIVPPLSIQQKFAQIVEKVEAMRQNQKQSQQEINNLFNTFMQKAFNGELTA